MKVRIFLWLMMKDNILTQETLITRGSAVPQGCVLCNNSTLEMRDHLMWTCAFAARFWRGVGAQLNLPVMAGINPTEVWWEARHQLSRRRKQHWDIAWTTGSWVLRNERNRRTFSQKRMSEYILINAAAIDVHNSTLFCWKKEWRWLRHSPGFFNFITRACFKLR